MQIPIKGVITVGIFKKKNGKNESVNEEKDVKMMILEKMNEDINGTIYDNCLLVPRFGFSIDIQIGRNEVRKLSAEESSTGESAEIRLLQVIFIIKHDDFDEPIIEPVAAQGHDLDQAIVMAVETFKGGLWHTLQQAFTKQKGLPVEVNYLMQHYDFDMYAESVVLVGDKDKQPAMLINFIKDVIPKYIGSKKYYWVRIFLARHGDKKTIEVRVNGTVCPGLAPNFVKYIDSWADNGNIVTEKQYAMFIQREDDKCPFDKELVVSGSKKAIEMMENCNNPEEYKAMKEELDETIGDIALSAEIRIFIPEILARLVIGYSEGDSLFLIDGESQIEFRKTQLRSYYYMQQVVLEYLSKNPDKDKVMKIVSNSAAFREIQKAVKEGHDPKELYVPGTTYKIAVDNYFVW